MSPAWQTFAALLIVALAALLLLRAAFGKRKSGHAHGIGCPALSSEVRELHARLARVKRTPPPGS